MITVHQYVFTNDDGLIIIKKEYDEQQPDEEVYRMEKWLSTQLGENIELFKYFRLRKSVTAARAGQDERLR